MTGVEGTLSQPPVRTRADGEAALAGLLRIGTGLGARVARSRDELVGDLVGGLLRGVMYSLAVLLAVVSLGALL